MTKLNFLHLIAVLLLLALSCSREETFRQGGLEAPFSGSAEAVPIEISIRAELEGPQMTSLSAGGTKSALVSNPDIVLDASVAWYAGGVLAGSSDGLTGGSGTIRLLPGIYDFYLAANMPDFEWPEKKSNLSTALWQLPSGWSGAVPMCGSLPGKHVSEGTPLAFKLTRLCARVNFSIVQNFEFGRFTPTSFAIRQAARSCLPFGDAYSADGAWRDSGSGSGGSGSAGSGSSGAGDEVGDQDYSSASDIQSAVSGGGVVLYVLENAMGTCPEVSSPSDKVPSFLSGVKPVLAGKATWIEVRGRWEASGVSTDVTYRTYLGSNTTTDFNVLRGRSYNVTLNLYSYPTAAGSGGSDSGGSWRIGVDKLEDRRTLSFGTNPLEVYIGGSPESTSVSCNYSDVAFTISAESPSDLIAMGISYSLDGASWTTGPIRCYGSGMLRVRSLGPSGSAGSASGEGTVRLKATTYDGVVSAALDVTAKSDYTPYIVYKYDWQYDEYQTGEVSENYVEETISVRLVSGSGEVVYPCRFKLSRTDLTPDFVTSYSETSWGSTGGYSASAPAEKGDLIRSFSSHPNDIVTVLVNGRPKTWKWSEFTIVNN